MFLASLNKELLLVGRDLHALLVLFAMPNVFILIMSLALQEDFSNRGTVTLEGWYLDESQNDEAWLFQSNLQANPQLQLDAADEDWQDRLASGKPLFVLRIHKEFTQDLADELLRGTGAGRLV